MALPEAGGMARIYMRDFSRLGLRFFTDFDLGIRTGQVLKTRIYLNPTFYLPVECKVVRSQGNEFGAEFLQPDHPSVQALAILQDFFDAAEKAGVLSS